MLGFLTLFLTLQGCSTPRVQTIVLKPPQALLALCPEPSALVRPVTNAALIEYAVDMRAALALCNTDKAALQYWSKEVK